MTRTTIRLVTVAVGVMAVLAPAPAAGEERTMPRAPSAQGSQARQPLDPATAVAIAARCLDPRHVALVGNAARHGRVFSYAEARRWCDA
jgi:hypothetical protein